VVTFPTHLVRLAVDGRPAEHHVAGVDELLALARQYPGVPAQAVILDRDRHATDTLLRLGWTPRLLDIASCTHPRVVPYADPATLTYGARCPTCTGDWHFDSADLPPEVERRAMPDWEAARL
jgi:hypothetical protein